MNIKHYLSAMAALAMLAACSDYDPGMSENAVDLTDAEIETIQEYTANFVERYGEMDPNHTWGFGELADMGLSLPAPCRVSALLRKNGIDAPVDVCTREDLEAFLVGRLKP